MTYSGSPSAGFDVGDRASRGGVKFSGLMFYNEEGEETGGVVYRGKAVPGGQDADVTLTMDQYHHDQNIYLHHEEYKDPYGLRFEVYDPLGKSIVYELKLPQSPK